MWIIDYLLDRSSATLLVFGTFVFLSRIVHFSVPVRIGIGFAALVVMELTPISDRTAFEWLVSTVERPSAPGLLLLIVLTVSALTGARPERNSEYRFGTAALIVAGAVLYPGATGFLNYDTYVLGYSGYTLAAAVGLLLAYALYRRYFFVVAALDIAIIGYLLSAGRSLNLWDYLIDPVGWFAAIGAWLGIITEALLRRSRSIAHPKASL
ncbi:hypothetical protein DLM45_03890 [Hyphomicrobium methylovorum]|uniref:hypothetical protein n=1 Tax=Hyphomicrobium methylovorum TaxID=84 RepID=UPI0015E67640|nr:hypothetical protein [Hyphomicrobium methylovorum]MBA2125366.1 hypothetical protein [Hyphomicrobium methylovorum]